MEPHEHSAKCKEIFAMLSDYLNLELAPETCEEIERHLAGCPPCVEFTQSLRRTVELCRRFRPDELQPSLGDRARAELMDTYEKMLAARRTRDL